MTTTQKLTKTNAEELILFFDEMTEDNISLMGGKGAALARMYKAGFKVPAGLVISSMAFEGNSIRADVWDVILRKLVKLRDKYPDHKFAVRSSALSEDSPEASFAGEFETVLNNRSDRDIYSAIHTVYQSRYSERVIAYSRAKDLDFQHEISVIVQVQIDADISGVLFTSDPISGRLTVIIGNYIHGLGDQLVSGEVNAEEFRIDRLTKQYQGPEELEKYAKTLLDVATRLDLFFEAPQDIEWSIKDDELFILQSRPITTFSMGNHDRYDFNVTNTGYFVWSNKITSDLFPYPVKPSTWSMWQIFMEKMSWGKNNGYGLICGYPYVNITMMYSLMKKVLRDDDKVNGYLEMMMDEVPFDIEEHPFSTRSFFFEVVPRELVGEVRKWRLRRKFDDFLVEVREFSLSSIVEIASMDVQQLKEHLERTNQYFNRILTLQDYYNERYFMTNRALQSELEEKIGPDETRILFSYLVGDTAEDIESIGPLVGINQVIQGNMSEEEFLIRYGHRSPYENYISKPRPYEDPTWVDRQKENYENSGIDIRESIATSKETFETTFQQYLGQLIPKEQNKIREKINTLSKLIERREKTRSEVTRILGVYRALFLRGGVLSGLGDDIFYLELREMFEVLDGDTGILDFVSTRKITYQQNKEIPTMPVWIRGRFDPEIWEVEHEKRVDLYDQDRMIEIDQISADVIRGFAGSSGIVEGIVRVVHTPEEANDIRPGEILVTHTTNVGWTPVFSRIKAVITDSGAVLSHAAIVARELGIPAVVGSKHATRRLKTGTKVRVNGTVGSVEILEEPSETKN